MISALVHELFVNALEYHNTEEYVFIIRCDLPARGECKSVHEMEGYGMKRTLMIVELSCC